MEQLFPRPVRYAQTYLGLWIPWPAEVNFRLSWLLKRRKPGQEGVTMGPLKVFAIEFANGARWDCVIGDHANPTKRDLYDGKDAKNG